MWKETVRSCFCIRLETEAPCHSSSSSGPGSIPGQTTLDFVVDRVAMGHTFSEYLEFPATHSIIVLLPALRRLSTA
jgi:hypothetical protein